MSERLSSADVASLCLEGRGVPQHVGGLVVFAPAEQGFDYDRLLRLVQDRISLVSRCRQRIRAVPGRLANPVWVDDPSFDITYHVRRSALPRPGTEAQLVDFCARIQSRALDPAHPPWEVYLVEGLADARVAIVSKTHQAMVDGLRAIDIVQAILDAAPVPPATTDAVWMPEPEPSAVGLVVEAVVGAVKRPGAVIDAVRLAATEVRSSNGRATAALGSVVSAVLALVRAKPSPLRAKVGQLRAVAIARTPLDSYRQVRQAHGGTVHDVILATVTGAVRAWLIQRGEPLTRSSTVRALVPVSDCDGDGGDGHGSGGGGFGGEGCASRVSPVLVDLPVGEPSALRRLARIRAVTAAHNRESRSVRARALVALSGFAPPTLHAICARAANGVSRRAFQLVVSNVPGPQLPLYAGGARMTETFPILPIGTGRAVSIGITSYDGGVFFGINADRDAGPDVQALAALLEDGLAELVDASPQAPTRPRASTAQARARASRAREPRGTVVARGGAAGRSHAVSRRAAGGPLS